MKSLVRVVPFFYLFVAIFSATAIHSTEPEEIKCRNTKRPTFLERIYNLKIRITKPSSCYDDLIFYSKFASKRAYEHRLLQLVSAVCINTHIYPRIICEGYILSYIQQIDQLYKEGYINTSTICYAKFSFYQSFTKIIPYLSPIFGSKPAGSTVADKTFNIIHISDIHLDNAYSIVGAPICYQTVCCRNASITIDSRRITSREFGEHNCDSSNTLFDSLLSYVTNIEGDIVYYTGDSVPHDLIKKSKETILSYNEYILKALRSKFPYKKIYPSLGNHEFNLLDSYSSQNVPIKDLEKMFYEAYAKLNKNYLDSEALETIPYGGYYTTLIRKGLRLISLNTNFCEAKQFWQLIDNYDPYNQLSWLYKVLHKSQLSGEKVHILGHHPFGTDSCNSIWSYNLNRIISQFRHTVTAIFTGHTHKNEFQVRFDPFCAENIEHVIHVGPSVTPYFMVNPAFNVYQIDDSVKSSFVVVDILTHSLNINDVNPNWKLLLSHKRALDMQDLSPQSYVELVKRMSKNDSLFDKYLKFSYRKNITEQIDRKAILCQLLVSVNTDERSCKYILSDQIKT